MKANYPAEYMASFMNSYMDKKDRLIAAEADCRRMGIEVLPPDINKSYYKFAFEDGRQYDNFARLILPLARNVSAVEAQLEQEEMAGQMNTQTLGFAQN